METRGAYQTQTPPELAAALEDLRAEILRLFGQGVTELKVRRVGNRLRVAPIMPEVTAGEVAPNPKPVVHS